MSLQQQQPGPSSPSARSDVGAQFALLRELKPTVQQVADLGKAIDLDCLAHTAEGDTGDRTVSCGTILEITLYLSSSLVQWRGTASDVSWDVQLRALVAALSLLLHKGVRELTGEPHDQLRRNIAARFNDIVNFSTSSVEDRMSKVNALYLIRLIGQYFSLFKRAEPLSDALPFPILGLVMAGASMAGGQYNGLRSVFLHADEVIGLIPGRKSLHLNLPAIQEITRRATTLMNMANHAQLQVAVPGAVEKVASDVKLVHGLLNAHFQRIPSKNSDPWNWPLARLRLGPRSMNKWNFFYGLLDCAAQLAHYHGPEQMSPTLLENLRQLLAESEFEEFRWKVREIVPTLRLRHDSAQTTSTRSSRQHSEGPAASVKPRKNSEQSAAHLSLVEPQWASEKASSETTSAASLNGGLSPATTVNPDEIQPCTRENDSMVGICTDKKALPLASMRTDPCVATDEADPMRFIEGNLSRWEQDGKPKVDHLLPSSKFLQRSSHKGFSHAGLSSDCRMTFFHKPDMVCVYRTLEHEQWGQRKEPVLERRFHRDDGVLEASLSRSILAVSTPKKVLILQVGARASRTHAEIPHGEWDPRGLALHEENSKILVAVGHRRREKGRCEGQVVLYEVTLSPSARADLTQIYQLPMQDQPKSLLFHCDGGILTCITSIRNSVLVWKLPDSIPVDITRHKHNPVRTCHGVGRAQ
ncbi:MAG: hypothetical protein Q9184_007263 [Pyrenodesmia sp. 2 TL-2023]